MSNRKPTPASLAEVRSDGLHPRLAELLVDEPDITQPLIRVAAEFLAAGVTWSEATIDAAIKLARQRTDPERARRFRERISEPGQGEPPMRGPGIVYYVQRGRFIKIGTTTNLDERMNALRPDRILAIEPGGQAVENMRHNQFASWRADGEHFTPNEKLADHIADLVSQHGEPAQPAYV